MKRPLLIIVALLVVAGALATRASAQVSGNATTYIVSVTKIELCSSIACASPTVVGSGSKNFNIADATVGGAIGSYASTAGLPVGRTFTHIRSTMSRTIQISGDAGSPGGVPGNCVTDGTAGATTGGAVHAPGGGPAVSNLVVPNVNAIGGAAPTAAQYAAQGITLVDATSFRFLTALAKSITVTDSPPNIDIAFQTANAVGAINNGANICEMFPQPPTVSITIK